MCWDFGCWRFVIGVLSQDPPSYVKSKAMTIGGEVRAERNNIFVAGEHSKMIPLDPPLIAPLTLVLSVFAAYLKLYNIVWKPLLGDVTSSVLL